VELTFIFAGQKMNQSNWYVLSLTLKSSKNIYVRDFEAFTNYIVDFMPEI